ncbi:MAG: long-chain fatty acid--CoA ligase [Paracoccaceae bacterium]
MNTHVQMPSLDADFTRSADGFALQFTQGLHRALQTTPDAVATVYEGRRQSFRVLADRVARIAGGLSGLGVRPGDRVAMLSMNSDRYLEYYLACPWMGALVVPINFRWSVEEVIHGLNDCAASVLFLGDGFGQHLPAIRAACPTVRQVVFCGDGDLPEGCLALDRLVAGSDPVADAMRGGDQTFGIFYTGGTTGKPKGVVLSHANILSSALGIMVEGNFANDPVGLHAAPMFHLADMMGTACLLLRGGRHVMLAAYRPDVVSALVAEERITDLLLVPVMMQALIEHPGFAEADTSSLRAILYGASPASESLLAKATGILPDVLFGQVYGMTETAATNSMLRPADHRREAGKPRMRSAGRSFLHVRLRIALADGTDAAIGEVGEILVRGPMVMQGYYNKPEATAEALAGGWLHTGDLGYMDEGGYVFIVDRSKDMILSGGENIFSLEVENAVAAHPAVQAVGVIGVPCDHWGERVHAFVVLRPGGQLTLEELDAHCRTRIAGYKVPRGLDLVDSLPMSSAGKLLKTELRRLHAAQMTGG